MPDILRDPDYRRALVDDVAVRLGIRAWVIEKDLWVCWALARLGEIGGMPAITFKGGTSLSKVHKLIERFSEDIDVTFSRDGWGLDQDPLTLGTNARRRLLEAIAEKSASVVRDLVVPGLRAACEKTLGPTGWSVEIDTEEKQDVWFTFPAPVSAFGSYGKPVVKIEFGARGDPWPTSPRTIRAYIEEEHPGTAPIAVCEVSTLEPWRTFWEKVTLLHGMFHSTRDKPGKTFDRHARHMYDVHRIWSASALREIIAKGQDLLVAVAKHKRAFFPDKNSKYEMAEEFDLSCRPHDALEKTLRADFEQMRSDGYFFSNAKIPSFEEMMGTLQEVEELVSRWKPTAVPPPTA